MRIIDKPPNEIAGIRQRKVKVEVRNGQMVILLQCGHTRKMSHRVYREIHRDYRTMRCTECEDAAFAGLPKVQAIEVFAATK